MGAYHLPTKRRRRENSDTQQGKINLVPMLDSIFNFIFFLLITSSFVTIFEIKSPVPLVSSSPPPKINKNPLNLTIIMEP